MRPTTRPSAAPSAACAAALLVSVSLPASTAAAAPITIGPGPAIGRAGGGEWREEMQDWRVEDVRGLDPADDARPRNDGLDSSRDLLALYSRVEGDSLYLRVDFLDLALGAEASAVDVGILIDWRPGGQPYLPDFVAARTAAPFEVALLVRDTFIFRAYDASWNVLSDPGRDVHLYRGAYFRSDLDALETGVSLDLLRRAGWDGRAPLRFQAYCWADGAREVADAVGEENGLGDGVLDRTFGWGDRAGTAKYAAIVHGNQALVRAHEVQALIHSDAIRTPEGNPTGYARALETAETFRAPLNIHVSGTLACALEWASAPGTPQDGPAFNARIRRFLDGDPANGEGALIGGVFAEHIMAYFEDRGPDLAVNRASTEQNERVLREVYGLSSMPRVFWTPERVARPETLRDVTVAPDGRATGYTHTVLDQRTHIWRWFGRGEALSTRGFRPNRIHGTTAFLITDDADQWKFANTDGGLWVWTRRELIGKALDPEQEQLVLVFDDWEAYAGRSFTSFGRGSDNPDNWNRNVRWLANHPWVQVVTLEQVAGFGWRPVERGAPQGLPVETYDWLSHASEGSYDRWFYGSAEEEAFVDARPLIRAGRPTPKPFGAIDRPGTLLRDVWDDVRRAPAGPLRDLAAAAYSAAIFETAWHDEDQTDYARWDDAWGTYRFPDRTHDRVAGWALGSIGRLRDASVVAHAASWAASSPPAATAVRALDVDQDGEIEHVISNDRVLIVVEDDGGRVVAGFARDPATGAACSVLGQPVAHGGSELESEREGERDSDLRRASAARDAWAEGAATARYGDAPYAVVRVLADGIVLRSDDGRIEKTISLRAGANAFAVRYRTDPSIGRLYVRVGLSPDALDLLTGGQARLRVEGDPWHALRVVNAGPPGARDPRASAEVLAPRHQGVWINARFGGGNGGAAGSPPRDLPLCHQVEVVGETSDFSFAIRLSAGR